MPALTYDHRSNHVTTEGKENGREIPDPQIGDTPLLDPSIRTIDWDGIKGIVLYTKNERERRAALVVQAKIDEVAPDPEDVEIAELGQLKIIDFTPYQFLETEHANAELFDSEPLDSGSSTTLFERDLNTEELAEILIEGGIITKRNVNAKKRKRN